MPVGLLPIYRETLEDWTTGPGVTAASQRCSTSFLALAGGSEPDKPDLLLTVTLSKSAHLSEPQFPQLPVGPTYRGVERSGGGAW